MRRDHRDEALRELLVQLALAGFGLLVVTALVGDRLARAALRPVERYRRRAAAIAARCRQTCGSTSRPSATTRSPGSATPSTTCSPHSKRALERERQFVNEASHELRTPITLLTSRIQLARRRPRTAAEHERILAELQIDLDRLARLADQLLDLGAAASRAHPSTCDLAEVAARVIDQRRLADPAHASEVSVDLPASAVQVAVADFEAQRIVTNLLDNAAAHGAAPYEVTVDQTSHGWARLTVTDAGPGMSPTLLETATRRFARADAARSLPGAGLGLALVHVLVDQAGGEIRLCFGGRHVSVGRSAPVECSHGRAMTVTILLPPAPALDPARRSPAGTAPMGSAPVEAD